MSDWETWSRFRSLAWVSAGGFSARLGHPSRRAQGDQKSTEGPLHATWREPLGWARPLPGQAVLGDDGSGQPELPEHRGHQPGPAVGRGGGAEPHRGPAQVLFGKAEGMFHGEAPQVPLPDLVQVIWKWTADPGQPQRHRLAMLRQVLELHAHDGEWSSGRILDVQVGPGLDRHGPVHRVLQAGRAVGWAMGAGVLELEDRAVCVRSTAAGVRLRRGAG